VAREVAARAQPGGARVRRGEGGLLWLVVPPAAALGVLLAGPVIMLIPAATGAFGTVLGDSVFHETVVRTVVMALVVTVFAMVLGTVYALAVHAAPRWVSGLLLGALFLTMWTSSLVRTFAWLLLELPTGGLYYVLHLLHLRNSPLGIYQTTLAPYPAMVHVMLPYIVLPVHLGLSRLDHTQVRAARVLGARTSLVIRKIVLPHLRPSIVAGGVMVFIMSLGFYVTPLVLGSPSELTVSGLIDAKFASVSTQSQAAALSILLLATALVVYLIADRLFRVSERWE
jgi:putative spermidine/putrescine transport system permease protein